MPRDRLALVVAPLLLMLSGCVDAPAPAATPTPISRIEACAALKTAVTEFYAAAAPGSTISELPPHDLPAVNRFVIPQPTCAFQVRPDPDETPGDVFTIEALYLDYDEEMTVTVPARLVEAGFTQKDPDVTTWSATRLGHSYSAAMLLFTPGDGQAYSEAAEQYRVLDLSIGQN